MTPSLTYRAYQGVLLLYEILNSLLDSPSIPQRFQVQVSRIASRFPRKVDPCRANDKCWLTTTAIGLDRAAPPSLALNVCSISYNLSFVFLVGVPLLKG